MVEVERELEDSQVTKLHHTIFSCLKASFNPTSNNVRADSLGEWRESLAVASGANREPEHPNSTDANVVVLFHSAQSLLAFLR